MAKTNTAVFLSIILGLMFASPGWAAYIITNDATGGACSSIGAWDAGTRTCTINQNLTESIEIGDSGITLDGNGHAVTGSGSGNGISASGKSNVVVKGFIVDNFATGIYVYSGGHSNITENKIVDSNIGIHISHSDDNEVFGNGVSGNAFGIYVYYSSFNLVYRNTMASNTYGLYIYKGASNTAYNNNFMGNTHQATGNPAYLVNVFNLDKPAGGNYWSDWTSPDDDADGFVDEPYVFGGGQDNFPWTQMDGWAQAPPAVDADGDGYDETVDCDDEDPAVNPGAVEICDGIDNNCDGNADENLTVACGEGVCEGTSTCVAGAWTNCSSYGKDAGVCAVCDDHGIATYDGTQNQDCMPTACPESGCGAGGCGEHIFGLYPETVENSCSAIYTCTQNACVADCEADADGDGYSAKCGDCNDENATVHPGADEICDGVDNDCNGIVDDGDEDGDGVNNCEDLCPGTGPEGAAWKRLLPWHFADIDNDGTFETRQRWRAPITDSQYTLADTYGCTCEQILDCLPGGNEGMMRYGCGWGVMKVWTRQIGWAKDCRFNWDGHHSECDHHQWGRGHRQWGCGE